MAQIHVKFPCGYELKVSAMMSEINFDHTRCPMHGKKCVKQGKSE